MSLEEMILTIENIKYFTRFNKNEKCNEITVIYGEIDEKSKDRLNRLADKLIRAMLKE